MNDRKLPSSILKFEYVEPETRVESEVHDADVIRTVQAVSRDHGRLSDSIREAQHLIQGVTWTLVHTRTPGTWTQRQKDSN